MTGLSPRRLREAWHCAMLHGEGILATILFYAWRALLEQQHASVSEASRWEELGGIPEIVNGQAGGRPRSGQRAGDDAHVYYRVRSGPGSPARDGPGAIGPFTLRASDKTRIT